MFPTTHPNTKVLWNLYKKENAYSGAKGSHIKKVWVGEVMWLSGKKAKGWIRIKNRDLCPCKCYIFEFNLDASKSIRTLDDILNTKYKDDDFVFGTSPEESRKRMERLFDQTLRQMTELKPYKTPKDHLREQILSDISELEKKYRQAPSESPEQKEIIKKLIKKYDQLPAQNFFESHNAPINKKWPTLIDYRAEPHEGSGFLMHKNWTGRIDFKIDVTTNEFYIEEINFIDPKSKPNQLKEKIYIEALPKELFRRLAVLTCVGNVGPIGVALKNKGHTAIIVGNTVYSFEIGGWLKYSPVRDYFFKESANLQRPIVVQEIATYDESFYYKVDNAAFSGEYTWPPYVIAYSLLLAPLMPILIPATYPFFSPGGFCSDQGAILLGVDNVANTPRSVFGQVKNLLPVLRTYFISSKCELMNLRSDRNRCINEEERKVKDWIYEAIPPAPNTNVLSWK